MKQAPLLAAFVLVALCLAVGWSAFRPSEVAPDAALVGDTERPANVAADGPEEGPDVMDVVSPAAPDARVAVDSGSPSAEAAPVPGPTGDEPAVVLSGRFVLYQEGLPVEVALDGTVELVAFANERGRRFEAPMIDSQFEIRTAAAEGAVHLLAGPEVVCELSQEEEYFQLRVPQVVGREGLQLHDADAPESTVRSLRFDAGTIDATVGLRQAGAVTLEVVAAGTGTHLSLIHI